jgi:hypothetical protein
MVLEMLVFSLLSQLTWLIAREYFIIQWRCESYKSYKLYIVIFPPKCMSVSLYIYFYRNNTVKPG